ncbi:MAG: hypothetical protein KGJ58_02865 [Patescibacteria group bacterium]|nr:hypothetical protein [Patescibacteria group bacterium]MDE2218366.1 hypothetical protein [Patescibacteria group bacterium]
MSKINIATIFDRNYLIRALAFHEAISKFKNEYVFWFLCLDKDTKEILEKLSLNNVIAMSVEEIGDEELLKTRSSRSTGEFAFTSKPSWINYIFNKIKDGDTLIYADNDIIYFAPPENILERMIKNGHSIGVTPHKFSEKKDWMNEKIGKYNAGLIYFISDQNSRLCVNEWRKQCIDWCYLKYDNGRFGDQLYMNKWPEKYKGIYEIPDKGVNLGSWNIYNFKITERGGNFFVDEEPLVCYHFHRIKFYIAGNKIKPLPIYIYHKKLYNMYTDMIEKGWGKMLAFNKDWNYGFAEKPGVLRLIKQNLTRFLRKINRNGPEE